MAPSCCEPAANCSASAARSRPALRFKTPRLPRGRGVFLCAASPQERRDAFCRLGRDPAKHATVLTSTIAVTPLADPYLRHALAFHVLGLDPAYELCFCIAHFSRDWVALATRRRGQCFLPGRKLHTNSRIVRQCLQQANFSCLRHIGSRCASTGANLITSRTLSRMVRQFLCGWRSHRKLVLWTILGRRLREGNRFRQKCGREQESMVQR